MTFTIDLPEESVAQAMLDDIGTAPTVVHPRRGRPPGSLNRPKPLDEVTPIGPKSATLSEDVTNPLPRRRRGPNRKSLEPNITSDQIADMIVMAHTVAGAMISPKAAISKEDAKKIGDAALPVMNDFGIVIVGKVVHVVALIAAVVVVEGPIAYAVMQEARQTAMAKRSGATVMGSTPASAPSPMNINDISRQLGVEVGLPA